jgi:16S rRNA (cytidine1402-2'-O)-methyltransferase
MTNSGRLYLVPTPIGNLEDMTLRGIRILREVDMILAEDTRTSSRLLKHYAISNRLIPHHMFNEHQAVSGIVRILKEGKSAALITDAGTPGISDPGFLLVRKCIEEQIQVECLPGATALIPALVISGLPAEKFVFEGFLPPKKGRQKNLTTLASETRTMVFYESPHRLLRTLEQMATHFGSERACCVCREISKIHEECYRGTLQAAFNHFGEKPVKGEMVVVVAGNKGSNAVS